MGSKGCVDVSLQRRICHVVKQPCWFSPLDICSEVCDPGDLSAAGLGKLTQLEHLGRQSIPLSPSSGFRPSPSRAGRAWKMDPYKPSSFWRGEAFQMGMGKKLSFGNPGDNRSCSFTQCSLHNNLWSGWSVYFRKASKWWEGGHAAFLLSLPVVSYSLFPVCSLLLTIVFFPASVSSCCVLVFLLDLEAPKTSACLKKTLLNGCECSL